MKKIRILLEWHCFPLWLYDENNDIIDCALPVELKDNKKINDKLILLQDKFDNLYIDDGVQFEYIGFKNAQEQADFKKLFEEIISEIHSLLGEKYIIENNASNHDWLFGKNSATKNKEADFEL